MLFFICLYNLHDLGIHMLSSPPPARSSSFYLNNYCPHQHLSQDLLNNISHAGFLFRGLKCGTWGQAQGSELFQGLSLAIRSQPRVQFVSKTQKFHGFITAAIKLECSCFTPCFLGKTLLPKPLPVLPFPLVIDLWSAALPPLLSLQSKGEFLKIMMTLMFSKTRWSDLESLWLIECSCEKFW